MGKRIAGICYIKVDGTQLEVSGNVEVPLSPVKREKVAGLARVAGYKETVNPPYVKLEAIFESEFPIATLTNGTNMTVTAELANGKVYTLTGAWLEGETPVKGDEAKTDLEFAGLKGIWQ